MLVLIVVLLVALVVYVVGSKYNDIQNGFAYMARLHQQQNEEMIKVRKVIDELQTYREDVTKTFKILDNELKVINEQTRTSLLQTPNVARTNQIQNANMHPLSELLQSVLLTQPSQGAMSVSPQYTFTYEVEAQPVQVIGSNSSLAENLQISMNEQTKETNEESPEQQTMQHTTVTQTRDVCDASSNSLVGIGDGEREVHQVEPVDEYDGPNLVENIDIHDLKDEDLSSHLRRASMSMTLYDDAYEKYLIS